MTVGDKIIYRLRKVIGDHKTMLTFRRHPRNGFTGSCWSVKGGDIDIRCAWTATEMLRFDEWQVDYTGTYPMVYPIWHSICVKEMS